MISKIVEREIKKENRNKNTIIHKRVMRNNVFVYLCNQAYLSKHYKTRTTFKGVNCKNCLKQKDGKY